MAEGRREEFQLDKPFWYHKWVTVRRADFCSECGKARSKDGALQQCSKCKSVSYVSTIQLKFISISSHNDCSTIYSATSTVRENIGRGDTRRDV